MNSVIQIKNRSSAHDPFQICHDPLAGRDPSVEKRCFNNPMTNNKYLNCSLFSDNISCIGLSLGAFRVERLS